MTDEEIIAEVKSWWWNLGYLEIYDRFREGLDYHWHFPNGITVEDVGKILSHAYNEEPNATTASTFTDMAIHLDGKFHGIEAAFEAAQEEDALIDAEKLESEIAQAEREVKAKQDTLLALHEAAIRNGGIMNTGCADKQIEDLEEQERDAALGGTNS
jgi:hypothetical protein